MNYFELTFTVSNDIEAVSDLLCAELADIGFESFESNSKGFLAYIPANLYDENKIKSIFRNIPIKADIDFSAQVIEEKNWNEEWEKNYFQPIIIGNECVIHSSFHQDIPTATYDILIDPKMSFGTGHHETTSLVIEEILQSNFENKALLDMGCGTSILAILASMKGANPITAIDIDEWCYENSIENIKLNKISNIDVKLGDAELLKETKFDVILANINRNILLKDIKTYSSCLGINGELYMSGFYEQDIPFIEEECKKNRLEFCHYKKKNNWVVTKFVKK